MSYVVYHGNISTMQYVLIYGLLYHSVYIALLVISLNCVSHCVHHVNISIANALRSSSMDCCITQYT